ncbi:MAG: hypothetical protein OXH15_17235 [Gammaproteobacteria bacterium]|nr:hypothetical protein [Gammaproteobacteria bacterium]
MDTRLPYDPAVLALIDNIQEGLNRLRQLVQKQPESLDPTDPRNKQPDGKFTPRGVEICYRLFDQGMTRYGVSRLMGISFGAATYRLARWQKEGGRDRTRTTLD